MTRAGGWAVVLAVVGIGFGCESPSPASSDGGLDAGPCSRDVDCDDGVFCNGVERCSPGATGATAYGCLPAIEPACAGGASCDETADECVSACADRDGDGARAMECGGDDCDDDDATRAPGLAETCDFGDHDEDCDPTTFGVRDADGDGHVAIQCCNGSTCGDDCDDSRAGVHPTAPEVCNERDDDCDGATDEGGVRTTFYRDADGDGFGDGSMTTEDCGRPSGYATQPGDCDESSPMRHPGVRELCDAIDDDCDSAVDERDATDVACSCTGAAMEPCGPATDTGECELGTRTCVDGAWDACAGAVFPRDEDCNARDDDCDGSVDEMLMRACSTVCGTGVEVCADGTFGGCTAPAPSIEVCNGLDDDCDGAFDGPGEDDDGDGFADGSCGGTDCDDGAATVHPGASDICDGRDDDCDTATIASDDLDGDGYLVIGATCSGGPLATAPRTDCNDASATVHPMASETCDAVDQDCNGTVDGTAADPWCNTGGRAPPNSTARCSGGACVVASCTSPYLDCTSGAGCETDGSTSAASCGACGRACAWGLCAASTCDDAIALEAGDAATCARRAGGRIACWGSGPLGDPFVTSSSTPIHVAYFTDAPLLGLGWDHACAMQRAGSEVRCWGNNSNGQLGVPTTTASSLTPIAVLTPIGGWSGTPREISAGLRFTCLRSSTTTSTTTVYCWGANGSGQLGNTFTADSASPSRVSGLTNVRDIDAGHSHACAVSTTGGVLCWGNNLRGQLGDGTTTTARSAVAVSGITTAVEVAAGGDHSCARLSTGSVMCWGWNADGQLGNGSTTRSLTPVTVVGLSDAVQITAGLNHTCARRATGQVVCWGSNMYGQIGDGTTSLRTTPASVSGLTDAIEISAHVLHTCAIRASGAVVCWGNPPGTGRSTIARAPVTVSSP